MSGFAAELSTEAKQILACFTPAGTLVWPDVPLKVTEILSTLLELRNKDYITGSNPYRLTKKGQRWWNEFAHRSGYEPQ